MLRSSGKIAILAGLALASATPIIAQKSGPTIGAEDISRVTAGTYKVDNEHTLVRFEVDHFGVTPYFGIFGQVTGSLTLDPANIAAARGEFTIPVAAVTTASKGLTEHLLRPAAKSGAKPDFFGAKPQDAKFVITSVIPDGVDSDEAKIVGNLTFNGVTKPVTLDAEFYGAGKTPQEMGGQEMIGFEAEAKIKRSDFGLTTAIPFVSDKVKLDIVAAFIK